jgi:hypothetical protein
MRGIRSRFLERANRIANGHRTMPEPRNLRKDEPHPVARLPTVAQVRKRFLVCAPAVLRANESLEVEGGTHGAKPYSPSTLANTKSKAHRASKTVPLRSEPDARTTNFSESGAADSLSPSRRATAVTEAETCRAVPRKNSTLLVRGLSAVTMLSIPYAFVVGCGSSSQEAPPNTTAQAESKGAGGHHHLPPPEAFDACKGKAVDDACSIQMADREISGKCASPPPGSSQTTPACRPEGGPRHRGGHHGPPPEKVSPRATARRPATNAVSSSRKAR